MTPDGRVSLIGQNWFQVTPSGKEKREVSENELPALIRKYSKSGGNHPQAQRFEPLPRSESILTFPPMGNVKLGRQCPAEGRKQGMPSGGRKRFQSFPETGGKVCRGRVRRAGNQRESLPAHVRTCRPAAIDSACRRWHTLLHSHLPEAKFCPECPPHKMFPGRTQQTQIAAGQFSFRHAGNNGKEVFIRGVTLHIPAG